MISICTASLPPSSKVTWRATARASTAMVRCKTPCEICPPPAALPVQTVRPRVPLGCRPRRRAGRREKCLKLPIRCVGLIWFLEKEEIIQFVSHFAGWQRGGRKAKWRRGQRSDTTDVGLHGIGEKGCYHALSTGFCRRVIRQSYQEERPMTCSGNNDCGRVLERACSVYRPLRRCFPVETAGHDEGGDETDRDLTHRAGRFWDVPDTAILAHKGEPRRQGQGRLRIGWESEEPLHQNLRLGLKGYPFATDHAVE